jgi:hypothetical protein
MSVVYRNSRKRKEARERFRELEVEQSSCRNADILVESFEHSPDFLADLSVGSMAKAAVVAQAAAPRKLR